MSKAREIVSALETAFREKNFDSRESIVRINSDGRYVFEWHAPDVTVKGNLTDLDSIGVLLNGITVEKNITEDSAAGPDYLHSVASAMERRINYLMEPLKIVELDTTTNAVQLRSEKPELLEGNLSYFEMILKSGKWFGHRNHVSLNRYSHIHNQEKGRTSVAFPLTKRQFEKLTEDLIELL